MLSIEKCKEVLNKKKHNYTTEEVKLIRETLYQLAGIVNECKNVRS